MKPQIKNANKIVRLLLLHGEKMVVAIVLVVLGLLMRGTFGRTGLDDAKQPDKLLTLANDARTHITSLDIAAFPPDQQPEGNVTKPPSYRPRGDEFPPIPPLDPRPTPPIGLRSDPVLLAPVALEVNSRTGMWSSADPAKIEERRREWLKEQQKLRQEMEQEREQAERQANERDRLGNGFANEGRGILAGGGQLGGQFTKNGAAIIGAVGAPVDDYMDITPRSWVTVLGRIPYKQQMQLYEDALATARGYAPERDLPLYRGYEVERAEVTSQGDGPWQNVARIGEKRLIAIMQTWPVQTNDLVDTRYVHPLLTYPLPPMVLRQWDERITHSTMPLPKPEDMGKFPEDENPEKAPDPEEPADPNDPFASRAPVQGGVGGVDYDMAGGGTGRRGREGFGGGGRDMDSMRGFGGGGRGMDGMRGFGGGGRGMDGMRGFGGEGMGMMSMGMGAQVTALTEFRWDGRTKDLLFRYFDDTVEAGKRYRYRVRFALSDVNDGIGEKFLDKAVSERLSARRPANATARNRTIGSRFSEWSEPSPVASVPQIGLAYLAKVVPENPANPESEAKAELVIKSLDGDFAAEIATSGMFTRGSVINSREYAKVIWSNAFRDPEAEDPMFDFQTGVTLLDFDGGEDLFKNRDLPAPARALVMEPSGRIRLEKELDSTKEVSLYQRILEMAEEIKRNRSEGAGGDPSGRRPGGRAGF